MTTFNEFKEFLTSIKFDNENEGYAKIYSRSNIKIRFEYDNNIVVQTYDKMRNTLLKEQYVFSNQTEQEQINNLIGICFNDKIFDIEDCKILLIYC